MKLVEKQKRENEFLERTEYIFEVVLEKDEPTPSRQKLKEEFVGLLGNNFVIKKIEMRGNKCYVKVYHYKSEELMKRLEPEYLLKRGVSDGEAQSN